MSRQVKIRIEVPDSAIGATTETVWGEKAPNGYRLLNSPFYAKGLSYRDIVEASPVAHDVLEFDRKVATDGHSTYRLMVEQAQNWKAWWERLRALGCTYEEARHEGLSLLSVDVPPDCDIHAAYALMRAGEAEGVWDFEEGDVNHPL